jgi:hypothetical protein
MDERGMEEKGNDRGEGWGIEKKSYLNLFWNPLKPLGQNKVCTYSRFQRHPCCQCRF